MKRSKSSFHEFQRKTYAKCNFNTDNKEWKRKVFVYNMCLLFMLIQICFPFLWLKNKCLMMNNDLNLLSRNDGDFQSRQLLLCSLRVHWGSACYSWTVFIHSLHRRHIQANNSKNRIVVFYGISTRIIKMNLVDIDTCIMLFEHVCSCRC